MNSKLIILLISIALLTGTGYGISGDITVTTEQVTDDIVVSKPTIFSNGAGMIHIKDQPAEIAQLTENDIFVDYVTFPNSDLVRACPNVRNLDRLYILAEE